MADQLDKFVAQEVLKQDAQAKVAVILGDLAGQPAIVTVTRTSPPTKLDIADFRLLDTNDVYSWGVATLNENVEDVPGVKIDVVWPATEVHIAKARTAPLGVVVETPEKYRSAVVPYIEKMRGERLAWVRAILHEGAEADRVLYRDDDPTNGFVLLPNSHWDRKSIDSLYLLAIVQCDNLASIRDLTIDHVPLIENIRQRSLEVCKEKWGLDPSQVKLYFHYQPSYYHLHVHVANVQFLQNDFGRSILLDNVIDMLTARPSGLKDATLSYVLSEGHQLWADLSGR